MKIYKNKKQKNEIPDYVANFITEFYSPFFSLFGSSKYKIKFEDDTSEDEGFGIILKSGCAIDYFKNNVYGLTSKLQLDLLYKNPEIKFKIVE